MRFTEKQEERHEKFYKLLIENKNYDNATQPKTKTDFDTLCINTIRTLSLDAMQKANPVIRDLPLGMAPAAYVLWTKFLAAQSEKSEMV